CQSIHGPSAYLVDLLHWLDLRTDPSITSGDPGPSALDKLLERRPDIENLPLTCENVERVLPYIDLTLEILEAAVTGAGQATAQSSEVESEEQLAAPQYVQEEAYKATKLGDALHSFQTPFHRPLVEARSFLQHLGVDRADLMRAFQVEDEPTDYEISVEDLGLSAEAASAILDTSTEAAYWAHDIGAEATVRDLRRSAELSYAEILDLLHTRLVNPSSGVGQLVVGRGVNDDPYDVSSFKLKKVTAVSGEVPTAWADPDAADYTRIRKVLRLWKATGWSLLTLDRVLFALPAPLPLYNWSDPADWSQETLTSLGIFVRLTRITGLDPVELASWFGSMDVREDRETAEPPSLSLYDRTWLSTSLFPKAEQSELEAGTGDFLFPFVLDIDRDALDSAGAGGLLNTHSARIAAVLGVSTTEVDGLIAALVEAWAAPAPPES
ncbi:MAG TPA: hypothetical protein PLA94_29780, partial [Myxococcota bacterium]|nr:hypothetical protein [Myxococcota bacterium]